MALGLLALLAINLALFVVAQALAPKPKIQHAKAGNVKPPRANEAEPTPVVWGTVKLAANVTVVWGVERERLTKDARTLFHRNRTTIGWRYKACLQALLCHGPIDELLDVIIADQHSMGTGTRRVATIDSYWPLEITVTEQRYTDLIFPVTNIYDAQGVNLTAPDLFGGFGFGGGIEGRMTIYFGSQTQPPDETIRYSYEPNHYTCPDGSSPDQVPHWRGLAHLVFGNAVLGHCLGPLVPFTWGERPELPEIHAIVRRCPSNLGLREAAAEVDDGEGGTITLPSQTNLDGGANPAEMLWEVITDTTWGLALPAAALDKATFVAAGETLATEGFGLSMQLGTQQPADDLISEILRYVDGQVQQDPVTGLLVLTLNRADYETAELLVLSPSNARDLVLQRPSWAALTNEVRVRYTRRDGINFNDALTPPWQDMGAQLAVGQVIAETVDYQAVMSPALAQALAYRTLRYVATPLASVRLTANRDAAGLRIGDVVAVTWEQDGLALVTEPFRVTGVDYDTLESGEVAIEAAQDVFSFSTSSYATPEDPDPPPVPVDTSYIAVTVEEEATLSGSTGTLELTLYDPRGHTTNVQFATKSGASPLSSWADNTNPAGFIATVTLDPVYQSEIHWQVLGVDVDGSVPVVLAEGYMVYPAVAAASTEPLLNRSTGAVLFNRTTGSQLYDRP